MSWHEHFLKVAELIASRSKDPSTKVGCVIVGERHDIRATGYNGLPRGVKDSPQRMVRPLKYLYTEHAERNAIYNAAYVGTPLAGCDAFITWPPCADCARALIQVGIRRIYTYEHVIPERWVESMNTSYTLLREAGVDVLIISK